MSTFEYLRISLARDPQFRLFGDLTREQLLREIFSTKWEFTYRKRRYIYDPVPPSDGDPPTSQDLIGIIGREVRAIRNSGPEDNWRYKVDSNWPFAFVGIDISETQQIAVFQRHVDVGSPLPLLEAFLENAVKQMPVPVWSPKVEYISSAQDFWLAAKNFTGEITSLKFVFVPPNMLRAKEAVDDLVRAASDEANASTTEIVLKNEKGNLIPEGDLVEAAVSTATAGGGSTIMKAGKKTIYSSEMNKKTAEIDPEDMPVPSSIETIRSMFRRLFSR